MPSLHHLAFSATDLAASGKFYDAFLGVLGYGAAHINDGLRTWVGPCPAPEILVYAVEGTDRTPHTHGRPGLQHVALKVADRATVLAVHEAVAGGGWDIIHPPQEFDYMPGYFATFIADPDGCRWEIAHIPAPAGETDIDFDER
ncbi:VOC family protein [Nocardia neocaledoniensis]|uniref:VOC family protein n=1 Tax=Nocardia neocaledoniensis TaxID=236511 RepID=UPI002453AD0B|nr:VOC family protein [Nocardia neocaledoniensis]